jgi:hypothetical protein
LEGDCEVVKRSIRDEPIWVVTHTYIEEMLGISLYSYLYFKLAKMLTLAYDCLCLLFNEIGEEDKTGFAWKLGGLRESEGYWAKREGWSK